MASAQAIRRTRGHKKRERTRRQLVDAALRVLARKGEGLTVSDVVAEADVANGTFYNYFPDREALFDALAGHLVLSLAATAAREPVRDPALRFALASRRVLRRAAEDPAWGRVVLRLVNRPDVHENLDRYLREDLAQGHAEGRFEVGATDEAVDQAMGLLAMAIRRLVSGQAAPDAIPRTLGRALRALGLPEAEVGVVVAESEARDARAPRPTE